MKGLELATYCVGDPEEAKWIRAATWPPQEQLRVETPSTCYLPWSESEASLGYAHPAGGSVNLDVIDGLAGCAQDPPDSQLLRRMKASDHLLLRVAEVSGSAPRLTLRVRPLLGVAGGGFSPERWGTWRHLALTRRVAGTVWSIPMQQLIADAPHRIQVEFTLQSGPGGFKVQQIVDLDWPVSC